MHICQQTYSSINRKEKQRLLEKEIYLDGRIVRISRLLSEPNGPFDNIQEGYRYVPIKKQWKYN